MARAAADAYLEAAELVFSAEDAKPRYWLTTPTWYVAHHLAVIACELFVKSTHVVIKHSFTGDESGPDVVRTFNPYFGHNVAWGQLPPAVRSELQDCLTSEQFDLLEKTGKHDLAIGRYPYEDRTDEHSFPIDDDDGRALVQSWLDLAQALARYTR